MSRLTRPDDVFFPVECRPAFAKLSGFGNEKFVRIPNKRAVVNIKKGTVVGVVGSRYRLVSNLEAMQAAHKCCSEVFPETNSSEWEVSSVDAPESGSYCHIDLVHRTAALEFEFLIQGSRPEVPEAFGPFIRVTNSYNGLRALRFSIGFYRKICDNGLVNPESVIRFQLDHTKADIGNEIRFQIDRSKVDKSKKEFLNCFQVLRDFQVDRGNFLPLIRKILSINYPFQSIEEHGGKPKPEDKQEWQSLLGVLNYLGNRYAKDLGDNAYAVLNAVTELASHPPGNRYLRREKNSMQKMAGEWLIEFKKRCQKSDFFLDKYLEEHNEGEHMRSLRRAD